MSNNFRIGFGFDSHQIEKGDSMTLGGVEISCGYQIIAHSDGDVVTHAICDALLGAAHLGDLGSFVLDDDSTKNLSSLVILKNVMTKITDLNMSVINIDVGNISCKATTTDGMGPEGRNEGISAYATVLLEKIK